MGEADDALDAVVFAYKITRKVRKLKEATNFIKVFSTKYR
jgi:hypothetical protein